jgi:hypothetical protein
MFLSFLLFPYFTIILFQHAIYKIVISLQPLVSDGIDLLLFNDIAFVHELTIMCSRTGMASTRLYGFDFRGMPDAAPGVLPRFLREPGPDRLDELY